MHVGDLVKVKDEGPMTRHALTCYIERIGMIIKEEPQRRFNRFYVFIDGTIILAWEIDLEKA